MKKVKYIGRFHSGPSVCYKGVQFLDGIAAEVSEEWYQENQCPKLKVEVKRRKKVVSDGNSTELG